MKGRECTGMVLRGACAVALACVALEAAAAQPGPIEEASKAFRVCADPDNLPFSHRNGQGFENKIAELLASEIGLPITYTWWPNRMGFIRNTLMDYQCDVVIGVPTGYDIVEFTKPYYRSTYVMVFDPETAGDLSSFDDLLASELTIGVVERTPPLDLITQHNLQPRMHVYHINVDYTEEYPGKPVEDVAKGVTDVALVWGPIGGYFADKFGKELEVVPLDDEALPGAPLSYRISMGVRRNDEARKEILDELIERDRPRIEAILREYGVPLLEVTGGPAGPEDDDEDGEEEEQRQGAVAPQLRPGIILAAATEAAAEGDKPYTVEDGKVDKDTYNGWRRYHATCHVCHGTDAVGSTVAPSLVERLKEIDHDRFVNSVMNGYQGQIGVMPPWKDDPNVAPHVEDIYAYLKARSDGALGPGRPERIEQ